MNNGLKDAEPQVINFGNEFNLFLAGLMTKGFMAALLVGIVAAVLMFKDGVDMRTAILLGGAVLSPLALFGYGKLILRNAQIGRKRGIIPMLIALGGLIPYNFGCFLVFYEGFYGIVSIFNTFTFGALLSIVFYVIAGYSIIVAIYRVTEFGRAVDDGRIMIKNNVANQT